MKQQTSYLLDFQVYVRLWFRFKANNSKNIKEKSSKCSLKTNEVLLDSDVWYSDVWCLIPKFDIYQSTVAPNCFKSHKNS